ncbi:anti-sigma F factor antagonist [Pseudoxanthomonas kalamensis DSM 18571]|uniref:STAS domain-containing protein n=1 Tax=Pseudoxanthomonas kalamensis TaxID=289483 RepID=UPI0013918009|nr:STAS domain-containing protein [Pseudoxanthomonas kalamensis]KAF1712547.1 anti-sigma F factor antagonist [Pseudoxanthomonas kalamensis DSM 18571]
MSLDIRLQDDRGGSRRVQLSGRLDTHTCDAFDAALAPALAERPHSLLLDLTELEYISSAGIRSIFKARKAQAEHGGKVLVLNPQPQIQKVFDVVKAVPLGDIFTSIEEVDAYLDAMQRKVLQDDDED